VCPRHAAKTAGIIVRTRYQQLRAEGELPPVNAPDLRRTGRLWPTYLGITGLLLLILVALAGGIIWYNATKSNELAVTAAKRLMQEAEDKVIDRIKLIYDPMYAIVGIASLVPELTSPSVTEDPRALRLLLRAARFYPQMQSVYVGFDDGSFGMVTHITGVKSAALRAALRAPANAEFAIEKVAGTPGGARTAEWSFLAGDGSLIEHRGPAPATYDPRQRPWFKAALRSDAVEESKLYVFASSGEPGFTLSRRFGGPSPGVMGADLAAIDLADFLGRQKITPDSEAFIFTGGGQVVAVPGYTSAIAAPLDAEEAKATLPKVAELADPVVGGLVSAYRNRHMAGTRIYDVGGRSYIGRIVSIPPRYGHNQLLAIMVPVDEIEAPIEGIRNDTLLYSIAFLVFALPLFITLVVAWIDRRLGSTPPPWPQVRDDE
jgi:adenylate cyclase